jgi:hypothetical protein
VMHFLYLVGIAYPIYPREFCFYLPIIFTYDSVEKR